MFVSIYFVFSFTTTGTSSGEINFVWDYLGSSQVFDNTGQILQTGLAWNNWTITGDTTSGTIILVGGDTAGQFFQSKLTGTYAPAQANGVYTVGLAGQINDLQQKIILSIDFNATAYLNPSTSQGGTELVLIGSSPVYAGNQLLGDNYITATLTPTDSVVQGIFSIYPTTKYPAFMTYTLFEGQNKA